MTVWKNLWNKINPNKDHGGVIEWDEACDMPPVASRPAPLEPERDEDLWQEFVELDSRPAPLGKETP